MSLSLRHSGDWLNVVPCPALGLQLRPPEFRTAVLYRLGMPVYQADGPVWLVVSPRLISTLTTPYPAGLKVRGSHATTIFEMQFTRQQRVPPWATQERTEPSCLELRPKNARLFRTFRINILWRQGLWLLRGGPLGTFLIWNIGGVRESVYIFSHVCILKTRYFEWNSWGKNK